MSAINLGDFRVTLVRAGLYWWDGGAIFGVVPKTLWSRRVAADEANRVRMAFNCYVIETGGHTILVETGGVNKLDGRALERMRMEPPVPLPELISRAGIDPERIEIVLNSHLHWDHCGWNSVIRATASAISTRITTPWWSRAACCSSTSRSARSCPVSG